VAAILKREAGMGGVRGRVGLIVAMVLAAAASASPGQGRGEGRSDRVVVLISVDGLAGHYLDDPKAEMPVIRRLAKEGGRAEGMRASTPTVTWPNHTTLVTGVNPARHGVVGNNYYDRGTGKRVQLIGDPVFDKEEIVRVPTIYDVAKAAGLRTAAVQWPAVKNAKTLDVWKTSKVSGKDVKRAYRTPGALKALASDDEGVVRDEERTGAFNLILRDRRPQVALLHLSHTDHVQHKYGPRSPEAYAAIKEADRQVGEVWAELKREFPGEATLVIASDHGFSPIEHAVLPNVTLREAGLIEVKGTRVVGGKVAIVPQGGAAMVYVTDEENRDEVMARVRKAFEGAEGIEKVVGPEGMAAYGVAAVKDDPHAPDMILFAKLGWAFGDTAAGSMAFVDKPEKSGTHGHNPDLPELHATFVIWGAGVKPGSRVGTIENVDVAPTMAKVLGLEMKDVDGKPVAVLAD
jgi:predicted AlkP superfamily pyrophosphatase or phosphodiesterase